MIRLDFEQGTPEWEAARIGIPTASAYDRILTPKTMKPSAQAATYRNQILAEWLLGYAIDWGGSSIYMERGKQLEAEARAWYEMQHDADVQSVGFVLRDDRRTGGSPDSLVDTDGGLEIKCPALHTHVGYLLDPDSLVAEYRGQTQGYLYLTGRAWWDVLAYHPDLPRVLVRIERDEKYIAALDGALAAFLADLDAAKELLAPHRQAEAA